MKKQKTGLSPLQKTLRPYLSPPQCSTSVDQKENFEKASSPSLEKSIFLNRFGWCDSNRTIVHSICQAILQENSHFKSLFIYGSLGSGKTELLLEIKRQISRQKKVILQSAQKFSKSFSLSLKHGQIEKFRQEYRNLDILLIDDFHALLGKEKTTNEFLHTFNTLKASGAVIILVSKDPPEKLRFFDKALCNRLEAMLALKMTPPPASFRKTIIKKRLLESDLHLPQNLLEEMNDALENNLHHLKKFIPKIKRTVQDSSSLNFTDDFRKILWTSTDKKTRGEKHLLLILEKVADLFKVDVKKICSSQRHRHLTRARYLCVFLGKNLGLDREKLMDFFKYRSKNSLQHITKTCENWIKNDNDFQIVYQHILKDLEFLKKAQS